MNSFEPTCPALTQSVDLVMPIPSVVTVLGIVLAVIAISAIVTAGIIWFSKKME